MAEASSSGCAGWPPWHHDEEADDDDDSCSSSSGGEIVEEETSGMREYRRHVRSSLERRHAQLLRELSNRVASCSDDRRRSHARGDGFWSSVRSLFQREKRRRPKKKRQQPRRKDPLVIYTPTRGHGLTWNPTDEQLQRAEDGLAGVAALPRLSPERVGLMQREFERKLSFMSPDGSSPKDATPSCEDGDDPPAPLPTSASAHCCVLQPLQDGDLRSLLSSPHIEELLSDDLPDGTLAAAAPRALPSSCAVQEDDDVDGNDSGELSPCSSMDGPISFTLDPVLVLTGGFEGRQASDAGEGAATCSPGRPPSARLLRDSLRSASSSSAGSDVPGPAKEAPIERTFFSVFTSPNRDAPERRGFGLLSQSLGRCAPTHVRACASSQRNVRNG